MSYLDSIARTSKGMAMISSDSRRVYARIRQLFAVTCLGLAAMMYGSLAVSQILQQDASVPPPERVTTDQNNVDVITQGLTLSTPDLSIGPDHYGLKLTQYFNWPGNGWSDSLSGTLRAVAPDAFEGPSITAWLGNQTWNFGKSLFSHGGDGATLGFGNSTGYTITTHDGTVITYSMLAPSSFPCNANECNVVYHPTVVTYPDGLIVKMHYKVYEGTLVLPGTSLTVPFWRVRIQSVTNNAGYQIKYTYQSNTISAASSATWGPWVNRTSAVALNNAVEYCDPMADACSLSPAWPRMSYDYSNGYTMTDSLNRSTRYTNSAGPNNGFRVKTAGSATDNIEYLFAYNSENGVYRGRVVSAQVGGKTWTYSYDITSRQVTVQTPLLQSIVYTAHPSPSGDANDGPLASVKDQLSHITQFFYPCGGGAGDDQWLNTRIYNVNPPEGNATTRTCDSRGNVLGTITYSKVGSPGPAWFSTSAAYPSGCTWSTAATSNKPSWTRDARNSQTDYKYYPYGAIRRQTLPADSNGMRPQKRYKYGQYYAYVRNASGNLVQVADPIWLVNMISECRRTAGLPIDSDDPDERCPNAADEVLTTYQYGAANSINALSVRGVVVTSEGVSLRTCYSYDDVGNRISVTTPRADLATCSDGPQWGAAPFTMGSRYDVMRQVVGVINPTAGNGFEAVRNTYDEEGRVRKMDHGSLDQWPGQAINWSGFDVKQVTERTFDSMGQLLTERRSSNSGEQPVLAQNSYDSMGRLKCKAVRMNPAAFTALVASAAVSDAACHIGAAGDYGQDRITTYDYFADGRLRLERRAVETTFAQDYATYSYTPNGRLDTADDARGNRSKFQYDGFDRISRLYFPQTTAGAKSHNSSDYEEYGYDENGNRTSLRLRSTETVGFLFDALNRTIRKTVPGSEGWEVHYGYTLQGQNTFARFGSVTGNGVKNEYDGFGRLTSSESIAVTGSLSLTYGYDKDGNRTRVTWPDGVYVDYTYDGRDHMNQVRENGAAAGAGLLADYNEDAISRRANLSRGNTTTTIYHYDGISRLSSIEQELASTSRDLVLGFQYNPASQMIQRTVSNDAYSYFSMTDDRAYVADGLNRYSSVGGVSYNYDGRGNLRSDGSRTFSYDLENHLLSVTGSGITAVNMTYDPLGRLWTSASGGAATRYLYDGDRLVAEYNGSTLVQRYVHGAGVDEPLVWYEGAGLDNRRWLHADHQGSVVATSNGEGVGTVYAYSAYGEPAYDNWGGSRFRYTGQIMLPEAKLYHYKARVYDPALGRFLQTDPVGYKADLNLYAYVGNDPLSRTDPTGLYTCSGDEKDCRKIDDFVSAIAKAADNLDKKSDAYAKVNKVLGYLGKAGDKNGVVLNPTTLPSKNLASAGLNGKINVDLGQIKTSAFTKYAPANPSANPNEVHDAVGGSVIAHEARHEKDFEDIGLPNSRESELRTENNAYRTQIAVERGLGIVGLSNSQMSQEQMNGAAAAAAERSTEYWCAHGGSC